MQALVRIDKRGNFEPGNCRWAVKGEMGDNRRPRGTVKPDRRRIGKSKKHRQCLLRIHRHGNISPSYEAMARYFVRKGMALQVGLGFKLTEAGRRAL